MPTTAGRRGGRPRGAAPGPLARARARPAQPLEPILIPKLRIRFADFPYSPCSNMPEAVHLGDLLRTWVRAGDGMHEPSPGFSRADGTSPGAAGACDALQGRGPYLGLSPFQGALPFTGRRELSQGAPPASPGPFALPRGRPPPLGGGGPHSLRPAGFGDLNPSPFRSTAGARRHRPAPSERRSPIS